MIVVLCVLGSLIGGGWIALSLLPVYSGSYTGWDDHLYGQRPWFYFAVRPPGGFVRIELGVPGRSFYVHWGRS